MSQIIICRMKHQRSIWESVSCHHLFQKLKTGLACWSCLFVLLLVVVTLEVHDDVLLQGVHISDHWKNQLLAVVWIHVQFPSKTRWTEVVFVNKSQWLPSKTKVLSVHIVWSLERSVLLFRLGSTNLSRSVCVYLFSYPTVDISVITHTPGTSGKQWTFWRS